MKRTLSRWGLSALLAVIGASCAEHHPPEIQCGEGGTYHEEDVGRYCAYIVIIGGLSCPPELPERYEFETGEVVCSDQPIEGESDIPPEVCAAVGRECARAEECTWDEVLGGASDDDAALADADADGVVYSVTRFRGSADFGGGARTTATSALAVIAHDLDGSYLWDRVLDGAWAGGVATTRSGAFVAGSFEGSLDFGGGARTVGTPSLFVLALDAGGAHRWDVVVEGGGMPRPPDGAFAGPTVKTLELDGQLRVTGFFTEAADFGGGVRMPTRADLFVLALDGDGAYLWDATFGGTETTGPAALAAGATGELYVSGYLVGETDFGGGLRVAQGGDGFVLALDPTGRYRWDRVFSGVTCAMPMEDVPCPEDAAMGVATLVDGTVVVTGMYADRVDFGGGERRNLDAADAAMFVAAYDEGGVYLWDRVYGGGSSGLAITRDGDGVAVAGNFAHGEDFGGGRVVPRGQRDAFVIRLSAGGDYLSERILSGDRFIYPSDLKTTPAGHLLMSGVFLGTHDLGHGERTAMAIDGFVTRLCRTR